MGTEKDIEKFVDSLKICRQCFKNVENMYAKSETTVENLKLYLKEMLKKKPKYLIVGEAPGYKGCRWSGIPFTSERNLIQTDFFKYKGYKVRKSKKPESEASATKVWNVLEKKNGNLIPLIWNAFPFHPYDPVKGKESNRKPISDELIYGKEKLRELIKLFDIKEDNIIAVGREAEKILKTIFTTVKEISHPANRRDGKKRFEEGVNKYLI